MGQEEHYYLNISFLDNRIKELELKKWWLAEEIGVDRKTVGRWLTGQTKKIKKDNLDRLAEILECNTEHLIQDEGTLVATSNEQKEAAKLIEKENLLELITPSGKWDLFEGIIKASMEPNLPLPLLGQLYNFLCISAWRKSDLEKANKYLDKAKEISIKCNHQNLIARTKLNEATLASFSGDIDAAIAGYLYCIKNKKYLDDQGVYASALSNIACVFHEKGELEKSAEYQMMAIAEFKKLEKVLNLSIAYVGLCDVQIEMGEFIEAQKSIELSSKYVEKSNMERGRGDAKLFEALINCHLLKFDRAQTLILEAKEIFDRLNIDEGRTYRVMGLVAAGLKQESQAIELFRTGLEKSRDFPIENCLISLELYRMTNEESLLNDIKARLQKMNAVERLEKIEEEFGN